MSKKTDISPDNLSLREDAASHEQYSSLNRGPADDAKMRKTKKIMLTAILSVLLVFMAVSGCTFIACDCMEWLRLPFAICSCINTPDPDMPAINYAEFPVVVTYEVDGEVLTAHNTIMCRYDDYRWDESDAIKHRRWAKSFENENPMLLHTADDGTNIHLGIRCSPELLMGDTEELTGNSREASYYLGYTFGESAHFHDCHESDPLEKYGVRVLSFDVAPPVQNTFTPVDEQEKKVEGIFNTKRTDDNGIIYRTNAFSDYAVVIGYCGDSERVSIPESVFGKTVREIDSNAFANCENVVSIDIPDSVKQLGTGVFFGCDSLETVNLSSAISSIPADTFAHCSSLRFTVPDGITEIGDNAFAHCYSLTSAELPDSVVFVGSSVFEHCHRLERAAIPASVVFIGDDAFAWCISLDEPYDPDSVTSIGANTFEDCSIVLNLPNSPDYYGYSPDAGVTVDERHN